MERSYDTDSRLARNNIFDLKLVRQISIKIFNWFSFISKTIYEMEII